MVLGERLELSHPKVLAPKASASTISPPEHVGNSIGAKSQRQAIDKTIKSHYGTSFTVNIDEMDVQFSIDASLPHEYLESIQVQASFNRMNVLCPML